MVKNMSFYRHVIFAITFQCRTTDKQDDRGNDRIVVDQSTPIPVKIPPVEYESKEEAYQIGGALATWAKDTAVKFAEQYAKKRCPGPTVYASDWNGLVEDFDEADREEDLYGPKIPKNIIELVRIYAEQIIHYLDSIKELEDKYNFKYENIKDRYNLPSIDIKL